jgi:hypothetical protein
MQIRRKVNRIIKPFSPRTAWNASSRLLKNSFSTEKLCIFRKNMEARFQKHGFFIILLAGELEA